METVQLAVSQDTVRRAIDVNVVALQAPGISEWIGGSENGLTMNTEPVLSVNSCVSGMEKCMTQQSSDSTSAACDHRLSSNGHVSQVRDSWSSDRQDSGCDESVKELAMHEALIQSRCWQTKRRRRRLMLTIALFTDSTTTRRRKHGTLRSDSP